MMKKEKGGLRELLMKNKLILSCVFFFISVILLAQQYDETEILYRRANQLTARRKYERANQIYKDLLSKKPDEERVIERLLNNYIRMNSLDKADQLLADKKNILTPIKYTSSNVSVELARGEYKKAKQIAEKFLSKNSSNIYYHKNIATIFEAYRQYEFAKNIYLEARKVSKDKNLYAKELAVCNQNLKSYKEAIQEYINFVLKNTNYQNYVVRQLKIILDEKASNVDLVRKEFHERKDDILQEIYALLLAHEKLYNEALVVYEKLDPVFLERFAHQQFAQSNLDIALQAYNSFLISSNSSHKKADAKIQIAQIYLLQHEYDEAKRILKQIYGDEKLQASKIRYKTNANRLCRELLAEISIHQEEDSDKVVNYLKEAKKFTMNLKEKYDIEFKIVHYLLMTGKLNEAEASLSFLVKQQEKGTDSYKKSFYYQYLLSLFKQDNHADSLLTELTIYIPESDELQEALLLTTFANQLQSDQFTSFIQAYQKKELYQLDNALSIIESILNENELLCVVVLDWLIEANQPFYDEIILREFTDQDIQAYQKLLIAENTEFQIGSIRNFLQNNPDSFLAPAFRNQLLNGE